MIDLIASVLKLILAFVAWRLAKGAEEKAAREALAKELDAVNVAVANIRIRAAIEKRLADDVDDQVDRELG